jgi:hypothetical protein
MNVIGADQGPAWALVVFWVVMEIVFIGLFPVMRRRWHKALAGPSRQPATRYRAGMHFSTLWVVLVAVRLLTQSY